jgi:hypothetical protein
MKFLVEEKSMLKALNGFEMRERFMLTAEASRRVNTKENSFPCQVICGLEKDN